jgi:hypothetical protein
MRRSMLVRTTMKGGRIFSISLSLLFAHCAPPPAPGDGAVTADAAASDVSDGGLATRPPVYPTNPPSRCRGLAFSRVTISSPPPGCVPWVGFLEPHPQDATRQIVGATACGRVMIVDPTMSTQPGLISLLPDGVVPVPGSITPLLGGRNMLTEGREASIAVQAGNGPQVASISPMNPGLRLYPANHPSISLRMTSPLAVPIAFSKGMALANGDLRQTSDIVFEAPRAQPDGSFLVERTMYDFVDNDTTVLTPVRRHVALAQQEGLTAKNLQVICAAGDGTIVVDSVRLGALQAPAQFDTGDRDIQRCSLANINGTLVGVASSSVRSFAFTVELPEPLSGTTARIIPINPQPYYLPAAMSDVGRDMGPFGVSVFGTLGMIPSGLGVYLRQPIGAAAPSAVFAMFDRQLEYESSPALAEFSDVMPTQLELYTGAVAGSGQIAVARFNPTTGVLNAWTAMCDR